MSGVLLVASWTGVGAASGTLSRAWTRWLLVTKTSPGLIDRLTAPTLTAILLGLLAWRFGATFDLLPYSYLAVVGVALGIIDTIEQRLPSAMLIPSYGVLGALFATSAIINHSGTSLARALIGMVGLAAFYFTLALATADGLGAGDVKLGGLLGLALGWMSWPAIVAGTFLGWVLGSTAWLVLRLVGRAPQGAVLPMGPFLLLGALVTIVAMPPG